MRQILKAPYATVAIALAVLLFAAGAGAKDHAAETGAPVSEHAASAQQADQAPGTADSSTHQAQPGGEAYPDDPHGHDPAVTHADPPGARRGGGRARRRGRARHR